MVKPFRSYYFVHNYLYEVEVEAKQQGKIPDVAFIPTWIMNVNEDIKMFNHDVSMVTILHYALSNLAFQRK